METNRKHICAECSKWTSGDFWGTGRNNHGVLVECKGWCHLKPNARKRWNYAPACNDFDNKPVQSFIYFGGGEENFEQDIENVMTLTDKLLNGE